MSINSINYIAERLKRLLILYIPKQILANESKKVKNTWEDLGIINQLLFIDGNGNVSPFNLAMHSLKLFDKEKLLKDNIFYLLHREDTLSEKSFTFLLESYTKELCSWKDALLWLKDNVKENISELRKEHYSLLEVQCQLFDNHFLELKEKLEIDTCTDLESKTSISLKFEDLNSIVVSKTTNQLEIEEQKIDSNKNATETENELLLHDVDDYLLKTVFGVKT